MYFYFDIVFAKFYLQKDTLTIKDCKTLWNVADASLYKKYISIQSFDKVIKLFFLFDLILFWKIK